MLLLGLLLSVLIGLSLGLLGGGGSILTLPILIYVLALEEKAAIATSLLIVGVTSGFALIPHARGGNVVWRIGLLFAAASSVGAFLGGMAAEWVPAVWLLRAFVLMMVGTAVAMLRGRKEGAGEVQSLPVAKVLAQGLGVGMVAGMVGAGGGFLVVPALTLLGGLPMRKAVGSSLLVISLQSLSGFVGHMTHVQVDYVLAAELCGGAVVGSVIGGALSRAMPQEQLRRAFGVFVLGMAAYMAFKQL